jgi:hypothetical protein
MHRGRIVFIVGLPASGKTTLAKEKYVPLGYTLIDDPIEVNLIKFEFTDRGGNVISLDKTQNYVVCDPYLCDHYNRMSATLIFEDYFDLEWIFFENDVDKCKRNNQDRGRDINYGAYRYDLPNDIKTIKIYERSTEKNN